jgi:hypothetical protein
MIWSVPRLGMEQVKFMGIASNLLEGPLKNFGSPFLMSEDMPQNTSVSCSVYFTCE